MLYSNLNHYYKPLIAMLICVFMIHGAAFAQDARLVSGRVLDTKGEALIGVTVMEVGNPTNSVVTDVTGTYRISLSTEKPSLKFNYIGFREKTVEVGSYNLIDIAL